MTAPRTLDINLRMVGGDAVRSGFDQVRRKAKETAADLDDVGRSADGLSHGAIFGIAELTRGIGNLTRSSGESALGMRELSGGIMRIGASLGPGAGLVGILAILGGVMYSTFAKARDEIKKTEDQFKQSIANMANDAKGQDLVAEQRKIWFGTPYDDKNNLRSPSAVKGAFEGSLADLRNRMAGLRAQLLPSGYLSNDIANQGIFKAMKDLQPQLDAAEKKFRDINTAIDVMQSRPADMSILPVKTFATREALSPDEIKRQEEHLRKLIDFIDGVTTHNTLAQMGPRITGGFGPYEPGALNVLGGKGPKIAKTTPTDTQVIIDEFQKNVNEPLGRIVRDGLGHTLGSAIADGITAGFQSRSIGSAFKGMGKAILAGLGGIFEQMGETMITFGIAATGFAKSMLNPLTAGPSAIAYGALLVALGASLGAIAQGTGGGGYGGGSSSLPSLVTTTYLTSGTNAASQGANVTPKAPVTNQIFVIGTDAKAWRDVQKQLDINAKLSGS